MSTPDLDFAELTQRSFSPTKVPDDFKMVLTVKELSIRELGKAKDSTPVLFFEEDKRYLSINVTRGDDLRKGLGDSKAASLPGTVVELTKDPSTRDQNGVKTGTIVVKVIKPGPNSPFGKAKAK